MSRRSGPSSSRTFLVRPAIHFASLAEQTLEQTRTTPTQTQCLFPATQQEINLLTKQVLASRIEIRPASKNSVKSPKYSYFSQSCGIKFAKPLSQVCDKTLSFPPTEDEGCKLLSMLTTCCLRSSVHSGQRKQVAFQNGIKIKPKTGYMGRSGPPAKIQLLVKEVKSQCKPCKNVTSSAVS